MGIGHNEFMTISAAKINNINLFMVLWEKRRLLSARYLLNLIDFPHNTCGFVFFRLKCLHALLSENT